MKPLAGRSLWVAGVGVGATWVVTRVVMAWMWWYRSQYISADVAYYFTQVRSAGGAALSEYPTPILWLMQLFYFISRGNYAVFMDAVVVFLVLLDALVTVALFWYASPLAAVYWTVFLALLGPIMWFRIDLIPAACVTLGFLALRPLPRAGGALLAVGAATKLWPALLILPACGLTRPARRRMTGFAIAGGALALVSLLVNGWTRSVSPITYQSERGLQIESLSATWSMIVHATRRNAVIVQMSPYHAYEVYGVGAQTGQAVASVLMVVALLFAAVVTVLLAVVPLIRRRRRSGGFGKRHGYAILLAGTAIIAAMIAANKTFSPQYLIWLAGPLGLVLARARTVSERRAACVLALLGCVIAGLTQSVFPLNYGGLLANPLGDVGVTTLLVTRNALMAVLTLFVMAWSVVAAWRSLREGH